MMNILLAGVGGQGIILASEILIEALMRSGYDVKKSEVHGMAQRGGSVSSHIRFGENVFSPLIEEGTGDVLVAFEKMESLRYLHYLKPGGTAIVNLQQIDPMTVSSGAATYPVDIQERLESSAQTEWIDALGIARKLGSLRVINMVMLGALANHLDIPDQVWKEVITERVPRGTETLNLEAFELGRTNA